MWKASGLPAKGLVELELPNRSAIHLVIGRGLIPIDSVPQSGQRASETDGGAVGSPTWSR